MRTVSLLVLAVVALLGGCAEKKGTAADELAIAEAMIRYQFLHHWEGYGGQRGVFCIESVAGDTPADPEERLMNRIRHAPRLVRRRSGCEIGPDSRVIDKVTGAPALILEVGALTWNSPTEASIEGGYYEEAATAGGSVYFLRKINGAWVVIMERRAWAA